MCHGRIRIAEIETKHHLAFGEYFAAALARLAPLVTDGLVARSEDEIRVTPRGRLLLRAVAMAFDAYATAAEGAPRYSRVI